MVPNGILMKIIRIYVMFLLGFYFFFSRISLILLELQPIIIYFFAKVNRFTNRPTNLSIKIK